MRVLIALIVLSVSVPALAQTATPKSTFAIDQPATDLAEAQSYTYRLYADGATSGTVVVMTCTGTVSPFECTTPIGAFTPGAHSVAVTASNAGGESERSDLITFTMVILPSKPLNGRIKP